MKKSARNHKGGERDTEKETSLLSIESRLPESKHRPNPACMGD